MTEILLGTHNRHKAVEISQLLADLPVQIRTLDNFPEIAPVDEDGETLEENALKKSRHYASLSGILTVSDDTGLEVCALNGAPGVYSARFAGEDCSYLDNNKKLLQQLLGLKGDKRRATFRCVIACVDPNAGYEEVVEGRVEGIICEELKGENGFGYDPLFYIPSLKKTFAELSLEEKNKISHRALALGKIRHIVENYLSSEFDRHSPMKSGNPEKG